MGLEEEGGLAIGRDGWGDGQAIVGGAGVGYGRGLGADVDKGGEGLVILKNMYIYK